MWSFFNDPEMDRLGPWTLLSGEEDGGVNQALHPCGAAMSVWPKSTGGRGFGGGGGVAVCVCVGGGAGPLRPLCEHIVRIWSVVSIKPSFIQSFALFLFVFFLTWLRCQSFGVSPAENFPKLSYKHRLLRLSGAGAFCNWQLWIQTNSGYFCGVGEGMGFDATKSLITENNRLISGRAPAEGFSLNAFECSCPEMMYGSKTSGSIPSEPLCRSH